MALTLEDANKARESLGLLPLDKLPETKVEPTSTAKTPEEIEAEKNKEKEKITPTSTTETELSEEKVLEFLKKRNPSITSLDEFKLKETEKTPEQITDEREAAKLTWALTKGHYNKKKYESFVTDSSKKEDLVFSQYAQEAKKEDATLTDEDIQAEFAEKYGLTAEVGTRKHKRGQEEIGLLADRIMKNKYADVYKADSAFDQYETSEKERVASEKAILAKAPVYQKDVKDVFNELRKITVKFSDTESYEAELLADKVTEMENQFLTPAYMTDQIESEYTKEGLKEIAFTALLRKNFPTITQEIVNQALKAKQAGVKGIIQPATVKKPTTKVLTKEQQVQYDQYVKSIEQPVGN